MVWKYYKSIMNIASSSILYPKSCKHGLLKTMIKSRNQINEAWTKSKESTHHIPTRNSQLVQSRSYFQTSFMHVPPSVLHRTVHNRGCVSVGLCCSFQEAYWSQRNVICWATNQAFQFHWYLSDFSSEYCSEKWENLRQLWVNIEKLRTFKL